MAEIFEKVSFDPYNTRISRLSARKSEQQKSANVVRKQLADLSRKINADISPVYTSRKIGRAHV